MELAIRYFVGLTAGLIVIVTGWLAIIRVVEVQRIKRDSTRVTGWLRNWSTKGGFRAEVQLDPNEPEKLIWVSMDHDAGLRLFRDVDVYLHPTDPAKSRLGGLLQFWLSPFVLAFTALLFVVPVVWVLTLSGPVQYEDPLHAEWAGRWVWFSHAPWAEAPGDFLLSLPTYYWKAPLLVAIIGILILVYAIFYREALWHGRLVWGSVGLVLTGLACGGSWHYGTYRLVADGQSVRERSVLGWQQTPWSAVRILQEESLHRQRWSTAFRRFEPGLIISGHEALVLADDKGRRLASIPIYLEPQPARRKLWEFARQRTGLTPVPTERYISQ